MRMISSRSLFFMDCRVSFEEGILVGQRENKTFVQHCVSFPTDPILIHLVVYILEVMKCGDGVAVGGNWKLVELVVQSLGRYLTLWAMPLFESLKNLPWRSSYFWDSSVRLTLKSCIYNIPRLACTSDLLVRYTFQQQRCLWF